MIIVVVLIVFDVIVDGVFVEVEVVVDGDVELLVLYCDGVQVCVFLNICLYVGCCLDWVLGQFFKSCEGYLVCVVYGVLFMLDGGDCIVGLCKGDCLCVVLVDVCDGQVYLV